MFQCRLTSASGGGYVGTKVGHRQKKTDTHLPATRGGDVAAKVPHRPAMPCLGSTLVTVVGHRVRRIGFCAGKTRKPGSNSSSSPHFAPLPFHPNAAETPAFRSAASKRSRTRFDWTTLTHVIALPYASKHLQSVTWQHILDLGTSGHRFDGISHDDACCCCLILTAILLKLPRFENKVGRVPIFCL